MIKLPKGKFNLDDLRVSLPYKIEGILDTEQSPFSVDPSTSIEIRKSNLVSNSYVNAYIRNLIPEELGKTSFITGKMRVKVLFVAQIQTAIGKDFIPYFGGGVHLLSNDSILKMSLYVEGYVSTVWAYMMALDYIEKEFKVDRVLVWDTYEHIVGQALCSLNFRFQKLPHYRELEGDCYFRLEMKDFAKARSEMLVVSRGLAKARNFLTFK